MTDDSQAPNSQERGFSVRMATPRVGDLHGPREAAEAEEILNRTRQATGPGWHRALEERLDRQHARLEHEIESTAAFCRKLREEEAQRSVEQAKQHKAQLDAQLEATREACKLVLDNVTQMMQVGAAAVGSSFENVERARSAAEILNRPQPPRTTTGENVADLGKTLIHALGELAGKWIERDPSAGRVLKNLTEKVMGADEPGPATEAIPAGSAAPESSAPSPAPRAEAPISVADLLAVTRFVPEEKVVELARKLGVAPDQVPVSELLPLAREAMQAQAQGPAAQ